jgi:hypothetical protein
MKDLRSQVVDDETVVAREGGDEGSRIIPAAEGEGGEIEARGPALRTRVQSHDFVWPEAEFEDVVQELGGLLRSEPQIAGPDLEKLAGDPQVGERQRRVRARSDDEAKRRR